ELREELDAAAKEIAATKAEADGLRPTANKLAMERTELLAENAKLTEQVDALADRLAKAGQPTAALEVLDGDGIEIVLRRTINVAGEPCEPGTSLGKIWLAPGVTLTFLVDAIRSDFCRALRNE
ncbi:MAG: hypothetical protein ACOY3Y_01670, partial [Acidobacteriota bacterium]